jgi:hypothetical protein
MRGEREGRERKEGGGSERGERDRGKRKERRGREKGVVRDAQEWLKAFSLHSHTTQAPIQ